MKSLVNNITVLNQNIYSQNYEKLASKPYKHFFKKDMFLYDEIIRHVQSGELSKDEITYPNPDDFNEMLRSDLWKTTGYSMLNNGTLYSASHTKFPNCTTDMFEWWFWWHSVESERYALWYPYCHVSIEAKNKQVLTTPNLSHKERYLGNTHIITEYLNDAKNDIEIEFIPAEEMGFTKETLANANITASACGYVYAQKPKARVCQMIHLFKETEEGGELISRYYLGENMAGILGNTEIKFPKIIKQKLLTSNGSNLQMAYEQVMHDQIEFTHLASILPDLYNEFCIQ